MVRYHPKTLVRGVIKKFGGSVQKEKTTNGKQVSSIASRNSGKGCSICRGYKVVESNSLARLMPELAKEWHPTKNNDLKVAEVTVSSSKKVW